MDPVGLSPHLFDILLSEQSPSPSISGGHILDNALPYPSKEGGPAYASYLTGFQGPVVNFAINFC